MGKLYSHQRGLVQEKVARITAREPLSGEFVNWISSAAGENLPRFLFSGPSGLCEAKTEAMEILAELPGVRLGTVQADGVRVAPSEEALARLMQEVCDRKRREFTVESLAEAPAIRDVRAMFRGWDMDPSKYRPSSEALLRRVVQGKGLYRVSNVVDIGNLGSIETGWPYGCYDRSKIQGPIVLRKGIAVERYEGIGKRTWHLEGRPVLADLEGPFGSPISDSTRSMITEAAQEILIVVYAPSSASDASLAAATDRLRERLSQFAGAKETRFHIGP